MKYDNFCIEYFSCEDNLPLPFKVRHMIYCEENTFLPQKSNRCEIDDYDNDAAHAVIVRVLTGEPVAVVRVIPFSHCGPLPFDKFAPGITTARHWGEVSRIGIRKAVNLTSTERREVMRYLFKAVYQLSLDLGVSHWVCMMPAALQIRMAALGVQFDAVGPPTDYHGIRQPCVGVAHRVLSYLEANENGMYNFIINR